MECEDYTSDLDAFSAKVPKGWPQNSDPIFGRSAKEYHVNLGGPENAEGAVLWIALTYYGPDHRRFTMEKFIRLNSSSDSPIEGERYDPVTDITVAGLAGKHIQWHTFDYIPPDAVSPAKIPILERLVVLPGVKAGFYVLMYHAPEDIAQEHMPVFEKVLESFTPKA